MTKEEEQQLHKFETRIRQLILKYKALEQEAQELYAMVDNRDKQIGQLEIELHSWQKKYEDLKVARMIDITTDESEGAQKRLSRMIKEIDKCIALINV